MSPKFIFRIDEIYENPRASVVVNVHGHWEPSAEPEGSLRKSCTDGVTGKYWFCDGQNVTELPPRPDIPGNLVQHDSFSLYYCDGYGFWVLHGDATATPQEPWRPLTFEHDPHNYSSYITNAGTYPTLRCQRPDQQWPRMLLPDIYQAPPTTPHQGYGGLKGDLGLFLGLVAFSMDKSRLRQYIPWMFQDGRWQVHDLSHGRLHQRGVVVYVYPFPPDTKEELTRYQSGDYGHYYH